MTTPDKQANSPPYLLAAASAGVLALIAALAMGWQVGIPGEWVWRRNQLPTPLVPASLVALLLLGVIALACRPGRWSAMTPARRAFLLALLVLLVLALQWALLAAVGSPAVSWVAPGWIIASPNATTYFSASFEVRDVGDWLASYREQMNALPHHARTHPPGFMLFFLVVRRLCAALIPQQSPVLAALAEGYNQTFGTLFSPADAAASLVSALLAALTGALSLIPVYLLTRELLAPDAAIRAASMVATAPAILLLGASSDQLILTLTAVQLWLCYSAWRKGSAWRVFLAGIVAGLGLFFSLGFAIVMAWLLVWLVLGLLGSADRKRAAGRALGAAVIAFAGFALFYLALYLASGYHPLSVAQQALLAHRDITTAAFPRTYWKWLLMNPVEAAIFAGLPLLLVALWSVRGLRRQPTLARLKPLLLAWLIIFALLDLSGTVRGEVGRIWLFLLWPAALAASAWLAASPRRGATLVPLLAIQLAQVLAMRAYLTLYSIL